MTTALATVQADAIQPFFTPDQERMILSQFLGGASKSEAAVLLEIVKRRRLDPFSRQVYFVKRWDAAKREEVWAIQTSIDGLRSIAERTGKYDGQDEPEYGEDEAGKFCKVRVYRKDWSPNRAAVGIAYLNEFIQKKKDGTVTSFWARMPRLMLAKCAEALAIRKAFPEDAAGLYISEEMPEERHPATAHVEALPAPEPVKVEDTGPLSPGVDPPAMDAPPPEDDPEEFGEASAMRARIQACKSMGQLLVLGNELKKASDEVRQAVRAEYAKRRDELKAAAGGEA